MSKARIVKSIRPYRRAVGLPTGLSGGRKISIVFDDGDFALIEAVARVNNVSFGYVVRQLVKRALAMEAHAPHRHTEGQA